MRAAAGARGSPRAGLASRAAAGLRLPVPESFGCPVPVSRSRARGRDGGASRATGGSRVAGRASLSPVEIKHRMGMGRFGSGWGWTRGFLPAPARGGFVFPAAPTYRGFTFSGGADRAARQPAAARPLRSPRSGWSERQPAAPAALESTRSWGCAAGRGGGGERARVTLPCLENINLHVKVRAGPIPATGLPGHGDRITKLYKMGAGRVLGPGAASAGRHGARWGGRWRVRSPGDVEICLKTWRLFFVFFFPRNKTAALR